MGQATKWHPSAAEGAIFERTPLLAELTRFTIRVPTIQAPAGVLDALDAFAAAHCPVRALGAAPLPVRVSDWRSIRLGRNAFLHDSVPAGWWEEYKAKLRHADDPAVLVARSSLMAFTWTETMQMLEPIGIDRWPYDLGLKYGIRDTLTCAVGRRWIVTYWSRKSMCQLLTPTHRLLLYAAATLVALRMDQLVERDPRWEDKPVRVTPRELAVLRLMSIGRQTSEIAHALGLGEETVRSHLKKAQAKLGVHNRAHAVAEALRQHLIP